MPKPCPGVQPSTAESDGNSLTVTDRLLELVSGEVALVGPTTPLSAAFASRGVDHFFGVVVEDSVRVREIVSLAGSTRRFGPAVRKVYRDLRRVSGCLNTWQGP